MSWVSLAEGEVEQRFFGSPDQQESLAGEVINSNLMSTLQRVDVAGRCYYVKQYHCRGKGLRRFAGRSRVRAEWENLLYFQSLGIPSCRVVAYGEAGPRGTVVTEELAGTRDLTKLCEQKLTADRFNTVIDRLAGYVRTLHEHGFVHNDLKWRNILVDDRISDPEVYLIDCPQGRWVPPGWFRERGVIKDLACLDKVAKYRLTRSQRLRFYLRYRGVMKLMEQDKRRIERVLHFFEGRE